MARHRSGAKPPRSIAGIRLARAASLATVLLLATTLVAVAQSRFSGTVHAVSGSTVTLDDGTSFTVTDSTRVVLSNPGTVADLATGEYVAITAARLEDGSLLASIVNVFPESQRGSLGGQFLQPTGNLMTNANIDEATIDLVSDTELMVSFQGGSDRVIIPPTARIMVRSDGTLADLQPGMMISANVADGVASSVTVQA